MKRSPSARPCLPAPEKCVLQGFLNVVARLHHRDQPETFAHVHPHAHATARLTRLFAETCGVGRRSAIPAVEEIECGAWAHDIGKYYIQPEVLLKPGRLNEDEEAVMRMHPSIGAIAISRLPGMTYAIQQMILHHHEHWDGGGYPEGLKGYDIPLSARIISVVDVYTALRSRRSYKPTLTKSDALQTLTTMAGRELDPALVEDFVRLVCD